MIIEVSIKNFRSIKGWETISLFPVNSFKEHPSNLINTGIDNFKLLKSTVIYGPNASGKSNILRGIEAIGYLVTNCVSFQLGESIPPYEPHLLDKQTSEEPVELAIDFIAKDQIRYYYQIAFTKKKITYEGLYFYPKNRMAKLFERIEGKPIAFGDYYKGDRKNIEKNTLDNQLFLSKASNAKVQQLESIYYFFKEHFLVLSKYYHEFQSKLRQAYAELISEDLDGKFHKKFNTLINALDTGINKIDVQELDPDKFNFPENMPEDVRSKILEEYRYQIQPIHTLYENGKNVGTVPFDISEESNGTQKLFALGGIILQSLEHGDVLVVDEFEKDLHPHIVKYLIQLFNNPFINKNKAQLIFATHDITQLDNEVFRRDQVWFTEKDKYGGTKLYSLSDFKGVRENTPFGKWYDSGRFSATPLIDKLAIELSHEEEEKENKAQ